MLTESFCRIGQLLTAGLLSILSGVSNWPNYRKIGLTRLADGQIAEHFTERITK